MKDLHDMWDYLDIKGRKWLNMLLRQLEQSAVLVEEVEDENERDSDNENPENNNKDYVSVTRLAEFKMILIVLDINN